MRHDEERARQVVLAMGRAYLTDLREQLAEYLGSERRRPC